MMMKKTSLWIGLILWLIGHQTTVGNGIFIATDPVNAVIGDISYWEKFHQMPDEQTSENLRIQTHLEYVEALLRRKDVSHLPAALQANRKKMLDLLHEYRLAGAFPQNRHFPNQRTPVFIDETGNICAVGYLIEKTAGRAVAEQINARYKFASIYEIKMPEVATWIAQSGLTEDECATIQPAYGGGGLIIDPEPPVTMPRPRPAVGMFAMEVRSVKIEAKILEQTATTTLEQVFFNPTTHQLQGYYFFPIPKGAVISQFSMTINGKETQGEVLSADKARQIYEDIVRKAQDPALLEYYEQALFRVRIFPIQPKSEQRIRLTYTESLTKENGTTEYVFPLGNVANEGVKVIPTFSLKAEIAVQGQLKTVFSPTHEVEIIRKGSTQATVGLEKKNETPSHDFKLYFSANSAQIGASLLSYREEKEDGFFLLNLSPGTEEPAEVIAKDLTFVVDVSGSMAGEKMEQAKKALLFCIANLNPNDRFNIVRFSTEASALFDELKTADNDHRKSANDFINNLRPIGGTNIDEALELALKTRKNGSRPYFVIFLTDGKPTIGESQTDALLKKVVGYNTDNTRIFTFGIGTELNTKLLDQLTEMTKAYRTYVLPNEDIEVKVSDFYTKIAAPILTDVELVFDKDLKISGLQPKKLPDLFRGSTLTLFGRYEGNGTKTLTIKGKVNGTEKTFTYELEFPKAAKDNDFIAALWASRTVGYLLDQIRLNGENEELKGEIVRLSKKYGIITPYTSYLIIEDEAVSVRTNRLEERNQLIRNRTEANELDSEISVIYNGGMRSEEGAATVLSSTTNQKLKKSDQVTEIRPAAPTLTYTDDEGKVKNLTQDIVNVQGRAFYNNGREWVDSNLSLQRADNQKVMRIQFNSKDYFDFLKNHPDSVSLLALGRNLRFEHQGNVIEIYE